MVHGIDIEPGELQNPQMLDVIARTSVLKMLDAVSHLIQAVPESAMRRIDLLFLDILKRPIRDTIDVFAQEFYQTALVPTLASVEDSNVLMTQFLAEWKDCPNAAKAVQWLLEQLAAPDKDTMIDEEDHPIRPSEFLDNLIISTFQQITSSRYELARNVMIAIVLVFVSNKTQDLLNLLNNGTALLAFSVAATTSGALLQWTIQHATVSESHPIQRVSHLLHQRDRPLSLLRLLTDLYSRVKIDQHSNLSDLAVTGSFNLIQSIGIFRRTTQVATTVDMVRFANILEVYGYTTTALGFVIDVERWAWRILHHGQVLLKTQKIAESMEYFERAAAGMSKHSFIDIGLGIHKQWLTHVVLVGYVSNDDESYLPQLLPSDIVRDGLWHYYHHVAEMYASRSLCEQAARFESLALQSLDPNTQVHCAYFILATRNSIHINPKSRRQKQRSCYREAYFNTS